MPKCEACDGDGQIEYGAYRGDEAGPTRECRLCGGVTTTAPTVADVVSSIGVSAQSASGGLQRLAHSVSESGRRFADLVITTEKSATEIAAERLEELRQKNEREQAKAESLEARRRKIESELKLLEVQRDTYIAKGTENIANKYEEDLRRELHRSTNDAMNALIRQGML